MNLNIEEEIMKELEWVMDQLDVELTSNPMFKYLIRSASRTIESEVIATPRIIVTDNGRGIQILAEGNDTEEHVKYTESHINPKKLVSVAISLDIYNNLIYDESIGSLYNSEEYERAYNTKVSVSGTNGKTDKVLNTRYSYRVFDRDGIEFSNSSYTDSGCPVVGGASLAEQVLGHHPGMQSELGEPDLCINGEYYSMTRSYSNLGVAYLVHYSGIKKALGGLSTHETGYRLKVGVSGENPHRLVSKGLIFEGTETEEEKEEILEQQKEMFRESVEKYKFKSLYPETYEALEARVNENTMGR